MTGNQRLGIVFNMAEAEYYDYTYTDITTNQEVTERRLRIKDGTTIDLESHFEGLTYSVAEGLLDVGKVKNAYTEQFADSDRLRVYFPTHLAREATKVNFTFIIVGDNRQKVYDDFYAYITGGSRAYWDNARNKILYFVAIDSYKPAEEKWHGSIPYLQLKIEVQNLYGMTFDKD